MTDVRVTTEALAATVEATADVRVTNHAVKVSGLLSVPARITTIALKVTALAPITAGCATTLAQFVEIKRRDGVAMRFTSLDADFTYGGDVYYACDGMDPTAVELGSDFQASNMEILGLISSARLTVEDIQAGLYDGATYRVFLLDTSDTTRGAHVLLSGRIGRVTATRSAYNAELLGPGKALEQTLTAAYGPNCRHDFGDAYGDSTKAGCKYDVAGTQVSTTVTALSVDRRIVVASSLAQAAGYWNYGTLTVTSGDNDGQVRRVKGFTGGTIELWEALPYPMAVGDGFDIVRGCARTRAACIVYGQILNYGGHDDLPGTDFLVKTPDAKL